jgi:hypothetical protein
VSERNDEELIERIAQVLRAEERVDPAFDARVMASVRSARVPARRHAVLRWWLRPRTLTLSPLGGLALAAGLAGVVVTSTLAVRGPASSPATRVDPAARNSTVRTIQFVLTAPTASRVALAGDFNGWSTTATPLRRASGTGIWSISVPLTPGRHAYAFVVDDSVWVTDPSAPLAPENDFGPPNSVVTVLGAST